MILHRSFLYEFPHKMGEFLLAEVILPVQNLFHPYLLDDTGVAGEKVRHGGRAGLIGVGIQKL